MRRRAGLPMRRTWMAPVVAALVLIGCSVEEVTPAPDCESGASVLIVAQSVSTADYVPCLSGLPDGWSVDRVGVNQDRTEVVLDSDRAGGAAAVLRLEATCDVSDAVVAPSDQAGAQRFDAISRLDPFRARRLYLFDGGCVSWTFDFDAGASATLAVAIGDALVLYPRADLNASVRETFVDEDL